MAGSLTRRVRPLRQHHRRLFLRQRSQDLAVDFLPRWPPSPAPRASAPRPSMAAMSLRAQPVTPSKPGPIAFCLPRRSAPSPPARRASAWTRLAGSIRKTRREHRWDRQRRKFRPPFDPRPAAL